MVVREKREGLSYVLERKEKRALAHNNNKLSLAEIK